MSTRAIAVVSELDRYLAQIKRFPLLTREEETELATRWREKGDTAAAHTLVTSNLRFVVKIANEYRGYRARLMDLIQEGSVGLMQAVKRFDPGRGYRLLTYGVHWIRAYICSFLMRSVGVVSAGATRAQRKLFFKLRALKGKLAALGLDDREQVIEQVAEQTGISREEVEEVDDYFSVRSLSLEAPMRESGSALAEIVPAEQPTQEELVAELEVNADRAAKVETAMQRLNQRERQVIERRYFEDRRARLTELGDEFGVTKQRVAQIEKRALQKIRQVLQEAA